MGEPVYELEKTQQQQISGKRCSHLSTTSAKCPECWKKSENRTYKNDELAIWCEIYHTWLEEMMLLRQIRRDTRRRRDEIPIPTRDEAIYPRYPKRPTPNTRRPTYTTRATQGSTNSARFSISHVPIRDMYATTCFQTFHLPRDELLYFHTTTHDTHGILSLSHFGFSDIVTTYYGCCLWSISVCPSRHVDRCFQANGT